MKDENTREQGVERTETQTTFGDEWGSKQENNTEKTPAVHRAAAVRTQSKPGSQPGHPTTTQPKQPLQPGQTQWNRHENHAQFPTDLSPLLNTNVVVWSRSKQPENIHTELNRLLHTNEKTWTRHHETLSFPPDFSPELETEPEQQATTDEDTDIDRVPQREKRAGSSMKPVSSYASTSVGDTQKPETDHHERRMTDDDVVTEDCPECGGEIVQGNDDQYCGECGLLVVDTVIDTGPEWRAFNSREQDERSRVGGPVRASMHDRGLSTVIGADKTDAKGQSLGYSQQKKMKRLRKWDDRFKVQDSQERNMRQAFGEIQRVSSEVDLPEYVVETASTVYRRALEEDLIPGRSIEAMATACVYIAIRQANIPKTVDEVVQYSRVDDDRVTAAYSYISRELGLEIEPPKVEDHLAPVASGLDISSETEQKAREILETAIENSVHSGKSPSGLAASAVYAATIVTQEDAVTQEEAADAGGVCKLTIRSRYRELLDTIDVDTSDVTAPSISG